MKKIIIFFLMILSITVFSEEYRPYLKKNITNKNLVFSAQIKDSKKVISIYKENKKLVYVYGLEGEKAEKIIVGNANKNLFKNENEIPLNENNNNKLTENFILFKITNHHFKWWFALCLKGTITSLRLKPYNLVCLLRIAPFSY